MICGLLHNRSCIIIGYGQREREGRRTLWNLQISIKIINIINNNIVCTQTALMTCMAHDTPYVFPSSGFPSANLGG